MKCQKCKGDFLEKDIQESHDVPCYLFYYVGSRRLKKQEADKFPRHWLCQECHKRYEEALNLKLIQTSINFSIKFFKEEDETKS